MVVKVDNYIMAVVMKMEFIIIIKFNDMMVATLINKADFIDFMYLL